ncbi:hypothetical protein J6590_059543 [Homalodisca vitripennis]|nr:hypothetical protein J6590_059543 [Homalodisca vitripennis]
MEIAQQGYVKITQSKATPSLNYPLTLSVTVPFPETLLRILRSFINYAAYK